MAFASWLRRNRDPAEREGTVLLKARLRAHFGLGEADSLTVSEIACPACGPDAVETIVLVMRRGAATIALKCQRRMGELAADPSLFAELSGDMDAHGPTSGG